MRIGGGLLALVVLAAAAGCRGSRQGAAGSTPAARKSTESTTFFGVTVPDPYRWLEDGASLEVQQRVDAHKWHADERGVTYARYPLPGANQPVSPFDTALYHHVLGSPGDADPLVFGDGYSRIAEYRLLTSGDGKHAAALVNRGDGGPADVFLR